MLGNRFNAELRSEEGVRIMCERVLSVSQMLLGMYRCTDIPGKFVWQPGSLTQAVSKGHWILLEDIDHAPLDVVSSDRLRIIENVMFNLSTICPVWTELLLFVADICAPASDGEQKADDSRQGGLHRHVSWLSVLCNEKVRASFGRLDVYSVPLCFINESGACVLVL